MVTDLNGMTQLFIAIIIATGATVMGLQKLKKGWKETNTESSVISIMHEELERMAAQNSILANELNKLQLEIIKLTKELHKLTLENQKLNEEITSLTKEVSRLQTTLLDKETNNGVYSNVG